MPAPLPPTTPRAHTYAGLFLIALSALLLEVLLTRVVSVVAWYHLAFFVISLAMLGLTAGGLYVFLHPEKYCAERLLPELARAALACSLTIPLCISYALAVPLTAVTDLMSFVALAASGVVLALPFGFAGVAITLVLTRAGLPVGIAYGVDLLGAALGCALSVPALEWLDAPSAALFAAALSAVASATFARAAELRMRKSLSVAGALFSLCIANASVELPPLRPAWVKGEREEAERHLYTRWNSHSRVTVEPLAGAPVLWAPGERTPPEVLQPIDQYLIEIDGAAGTVMARLGRGPGDHAYLDWDLTALVHELRPRGPAAVIGVGGGHDVLAAARVQHRPIVGIELNRAIVHLHEQELSAFSGLSTLRSVRLVQDEARSYLARDRGAYSVIAMSLIDTWASTGTGAYSLSENGLYTIEAFHTFVSRLTRDGILAVSRWYYEDNPGETARLFALALHTLWASGARDPRAHIAVLQNRLVATLLLSRSPLSERDRALLESSAQRRGYNLLVLPNRTPTVPILRAIGSQPSREALARWADTQPLDLSAPSDARPFFFNMLRPSSWLLDRAKVDALDLPFLGNLRATQSLLYAVLVTLVLAVLALALPLYVRARELASLARGDTAALLAYFALIGLGFMFVEIGLLSRLSVFLGHPTLALAVLLGGIIVFTGCGSLLSQRVPLTPTVALWYPLVPALAIVAASAALSPVTSAGASEHTGARVSLSLLILLFPATAMGVCFPLGLRLASGVERSAESRLGPWLWGINGAFGVVASGLALTTSIVWGVPTTLGCGAVCYGLLVLTTLRLRRALRSA